MAMLAEPRRKQKVINLRAKNNAWSNDNTKFGQRMLEKMGWSSGKGLGAKENGIVEHVVVRYKNDEKGLGFEDRSDQWTKHEDDFNSLLANLSNADSGTDTLTSGISLEKKSKKSKARIHYHKFTRGKDLSRYSEKDLANIFGKKSFKELEVKESIKEDTVKISEQVFTEKGNMDDYFKNKLAAFKSKSKISNTDSNSRDNKESDYAFQGFSNPTEPESNKNGVVYQPFSFYSSHNKNSSQNVESSCPELETKSKKKKKSKQKELNSEAVIEANNVPVLIQETAQEIMMDVESTKVKKSKKKKKVECNEGTLLLDKASEESNSKQNLKDAAQNVLKDVESTKVKKSKKNKYRELNCETQLLDKIEEKDSEQPQELLKNTQDVKSLKKKSKKKKFQECVENEIQACDELVKKKSKNCVEQTPEKIYVVDSIPRKKKKRKNKYL